MAITVHPGLTARLRGTVSLLIRTGRWEPAERAAAGVEAAIPDLLRTGVVLATGEDVIAGEIIGADGARRRLSDADWDEVHELDGPSYVSEPATVPDGQLLMIDFASTPSRLCQEIPGILARHLAEARVRDAEIDIAPKVSDARVRAIRSYSPVARALLLGASSASGGSRAAERVVPSPGLVTLAEEWLRGQQHPRTELMALVISTEVPLTWNTLRGVVDAALPAGNAIPVLAIDAGSTMASALLGEFFGHGVALNIAGKGWRFQQVASQMRGQRDLIRARVPGLSELAWAGVTASGQGMDLIMAELTAWGEDDVGPMWYQVLSEAQLQRLGGPPPGAMELSPGRFELTIGEPEQWVPGHPQRDATQAHARRILGPSPG